MTPFVCFRVVFHREWVKFIEVSEMVRAVLLVHFFSEVIGFFPSLKVWIMSLSCGGMAPAWARARDAGDAKALVMVKGQRVVISGNRSVSVFSSRDGGLLCGSVVSSRVWAVSFVPSDTSEMSLAVSLCRSGLKGNVIV